MHRPRSQQLRRLLLICALLWPALIAAQSPIVISVDAAAGRHPISSNVYGVAHVSTSELSDLNAPLDRNGGNNTTRYKYGAQTGNDAQWFADAGNGVRTNG